MIYNIREFIPKGDKPGYWGFNAELDLGAALKFKGEKLNAKFLPSFQEEARQIISEFNLDNLGIVEHPYRFVEDSFLLHSIKVPGNGCDLGLSENSKQTLSSRIEENDYVFFPLKYTPHNVDNLFQASALVSLFLHWANLGNDLFIQNRN